MYSDVQRGAAKGLGANTETKERRIETGELFDVTGIGLEEATQCFKQPQSGVATDSAQIGSGLDGPADALAITLGCGKWVRFDGHFFEIGHAQPEVG